VHDAVTLESAGLPSVCLESGAFSNQAQYQADMLNLHDVRVAFVPHPISNAASTELVRRAEEAFTSVVQALGSDEPLQPPAWLGNAKQGCAS